jgi:outer membrane protein assembly factor BamD (BamD/ComL family)
MSAKGRGDSRTAIDALGRLLDRYPASPFAESAALERIKLLAAIDRARAADEAREYLRRYPSGFGRADVEALAR